MDFKQEKNIDITVDTVRFCLLWLKILSLKVLSLGLYAPWGNQKVSQVLLSSTLLNKHSFKSSAHAMNVMKIRTVFIAYLFMLFTFFVIYLEMSWPALLIFLISLPGYYVLEKKYQFNSISYKEDNTRFSISLINLYTSISLPLGLFLLMSAIVFNNAIIDSRFLASIDTKDEPIEYAESSYLARAEKEANRFSTAKNFDEHYDEHSEKSSHAHTRHDEKQWHESVTEEEKAYLEDYEKSHNHGSVALSRLQKYQITQQGNQFIQYLLVFILLCCLWPWIDYKAMSFLISHTQFLGNRWQLKSDLPSLYGLYVKVFLTMLAIFILAGMLIRISLMGSEGSSIEFWSNILVHAFWFIPSVVFVTLFILSLLFTWRKQWLLSNLQGEVIKLDSRFSYFQTFVLSMINAVALFFTLGLAYPWCYLRTYQYFTRRLTIQL